MTLSNKALRKIPVFLDDLRKLSKAFDIEASPDVTLKINEAISLIDDLVSENARLQNAWTSSFKQAMVNGDAANRLKLQLNEQLNDCINFDGGKLTDAIMEDSSMLLKSI